MKIVHFADAHIDMANYGRHDPETGLPLRVLDFLRSLDTIVDTAIAEKADLVIFAGDAYKDRNPAPTFQREWGRRIMRLSRAGIPTILLVGTHDLSPAVGRAHAIQEFDTLQVPNVHVIAKPQLLGPDQLGIPLQVIGLPWVSRSGLMSAVETSATEPDKLYSEIEQRVSDVVRTLIESAVSSLPVILTAHASVQGASYGAERTVMLGSSTSEKLSIRYHTYEDVRFKDFVNGLLRLRLKTRRLGPIPRPLQFTPRSALRSPHYDWPVTVRRLFERLNAFLTDSTVVVADVGDALFGATRLVHP